MSDRYFLISYVYGSPQHYGFGQISVVNETYPSLTLIQQSIKDVWVTPSRNIVILNILEFKNQADYESFNRTTT